MRLVPNFLELAFKIWREPSSTSLLFMDSLFAYARYTDAWVSLSCIFISYAITMRVILTLGSVYHVFLYLTRSLCAFYWHLGQSIMYFYILRDHYARFTDTWVSLSYIFISYAITMRVLLTLGSVYHIFLFLTRSLCALYWRLGQSIIYFYFLRDHYARYTDAWVSLSFFLFLTRSLCALYWRLGQSIIYFCFLRDHHARYTDAWVSLSYFFFLRDHYARYTDAWVSLSCIFISYAITMRVILTLGSVYHVFISYAITMRVLLTLGSVYHVFLYLTRSLCAFYWHLGQSIIYFYFLRDHIARFTDACQTNSLCGTLAPMWLGWTRLWMYCQELIIVICSDQPVSALAKYLRCSKRTNPHTINTSLRWDTMR